MSNPAARRFNKRLLAICAMTACLGAPVQAMSIQDLACGATICLAGDGGSACRPFLKYYKSIDGATRSITKRLRKRFLKLCKKKDVPDVSFLTQDDKADKTD